MLKIKGHKCDSQQQIAIISQLIYRETQLLRQIIQIERVYREGEARENCEDNGEVEGAGLDACILLARILLLAHTYQHYGYNDEEHPEVVIDCQSLLVNYVEYDGGAGHRHTEDARYYA